MILERNFISENLGNSIDKIAVNRTNAPKYLYILIQIQPYLT